MKFTRTNDGGTTQYRAEGVSFRYMAERVGESWSLTIRRLESVAGLRVAVAGRPFSDTDHDTLKLCKRVAEEFETLTDDYRSSEHGHRERITEATLRAYDETENTTPEETTMTPITAEAPAETAQTPKPTTFASYMGTADLGITSPGGRTAHIYSGLGDSKCWCGKVLTGPTTLGAGRTVCKTAMTRIKAAHQDSNEETPMAATRRDITTEDGVKAKAEIAANIDRIISLRSEGNEEGATELEKDTEAIISSLSGKGVAAAKASARAAVREAMNQPLRNTQSSEVVTLETQDYTAVEGAEKIVSDAAKRITEALRASMKVSDLAKEIAAAKISLAVQFTDAEGNPDFFMKSAASKAAGRAMFDQATKGMDDTEESRTALGSLLRAVQFQHGPARLAYVASLDSNPEEAARWRELLELSEDDKPSEAVGALVQRMTPRSDSPVAALPTGSEEYVKEATRVDRAQKLLTTAVKRAPKLDDAEREKLKAKLTAAATALIAEASAL